MNSRLPNEYQAHKLLDNGVEFCCVDDDPPIIPTNRNYGDGYWNRYNERERRREDFEHRMINDLEPNNFQPFQLSIYFKLKNNNDLLRVWGPWGRVEENVRTLKGDYVVKEVSADPWNATLFKLLRWDLFRTLIHINMRKGRIAEPNDVIYDTGGRGLGDIHFSYRWFIESDDEPYVSSDEEPYYQPYKRIKH